MKTTYKFHFEIDGNLQRVKSQDNRYGYIDIHTQEEVIPCIYEMITPWIGNNTKISGVSSAIHNGHKLHLYLR